MMCNTVQITGIATLLIRMPYSISLLLIRRFSKRVQGFMSQKASFISRLDDLGESGARKPRNHQLCTVMNMMFRVTQWGPSEV